MFTRHEARYKAKPDVESAPEKTPDAKPVAEKPKETIPTKPLDKKETSAETPKRLRELYETTKKEVDASQAKIKAYEAELAELRSKGKTSAAIMEQLEAERKEKEALMGELRRAKKEVDPKFKEKWEKPFEQSADYARRVIEGLEVQTLDADGIATGTRPAKWDDFAALYGLPVSQRNRKIRELFTDDATTVISHMDRLHELDFQKSKALAEEQARWKEEETKESANAALAKERDAADEAKVRKQLIEESRELFDELPDDPEGNALLKEGREYMEYKPKTRDEAFRVWQRNKLKAEGFDRMRHWRDKALAENAELKQIIEEMKNSKPGGTKRVGEGQPAGDSKSFLEEMKEVENMR